MQAEGSLWRAPRRHHPGFTVPQVRVEHVPEEVVMQDHRIGELSNLLVEGVLGLSASRVGEKIVGGCPGHKAQGNQRNSGDEAIH